MRVREAGTSQICRACPLAANNVSLLGVFTHVDPKQMPQHACGWLLTSAPMESCTGELNHAGHHPAAATAGPAAHRDRARHAGRVRRRSRRRGRHLLHGAHVRRPARPLVKGGAKWMLGWHAALGRLFNDQVTWHMASPLPSGEQPGTCLEATCVQTAPQHCHA